MGLDKRNLPLVLAVVIVSAWAFTLLLNAFVTTYTAPPTIHALMMMVAGWAFSHDYIERQKRNGRNGDDAS